MKAKQVLQVIFLFISFLASTAQVLAQGGGSIISPGSTVGQYEKIEFGVDVTATVQTDINNFFGSGGYGYAFNKTGNNLNPYDPDNISVEATFKFLGTPVVPDQVVYAFYYREYAYKDINGNPVAEANVNVNTKWVEQPITNHWRVRFAPKYIGDWQVTFKYRRGTNPLVTLGSAVNFTCAGSFNKGFLKFGSNNKYMVTATNEPVFPAGVCEGWPLPEDYDSDNHKYRVIEYTEHRRKMKRIAQEGGNYTKVVLIPYSYQVEWERLTIYDMDPNFPLTSSNVYGTNRQALLWEFDRVLDMASSNNLYIHLSLEAGEGYQRKPNSPYDAYIWENNPYKKEIPGINYFEDIFGNNATATSAYKKRLRYIIARWGYSTSISSMELLNEVETIIPYNTLANNNIDAFGTFISNWHNDISTYIKVGLNHKNHLLSVCHGSFNLNTGAHTWTLGSKPNIDFLNRHPYGYSRNKSSGIYEDVKYMTDPSVGGYNKPTFVTEFGFSLNHCGNLMDSHPDCQDPRTGMWASSFTGSPVAGLAWYPGMDAGLNKMMPDIRTLRSFFNGHNLDAGNFVPRRFPAQSAITPNDLLETYMLLNNNGTNATEVMGWTHNKSDYWRNTIRNTQCSSYSAILASLYATQTCDENRTGFIDDIYTCPAEGQLGTVTITGVSPSTSFAVEWYNTTTGVMAKSELATSTAGSVLTITPPAMVKGAHDYAFKARVHNNGFCNPKDILAIANVDGPTSKKALLLNNRCNQANGAIRTINYDSDIQTTAWHGAGVFNGWMDSDDKLFVGNVNDDNVDEVVLVNTSYSFGAIEAVNIKTGATISNIPHGSFGGWMDATDKMFFGDVDGDMKNDLVLVNTSMSGGAIRTINIMTGASAVINHGSFNTWMDATDKMFLADVNGDNKKDLVFVNTSLTGDAIRAINPVTGSDIYTLNNSTLGLGGWIDATDKMFMGDLNNDGKEDLVLVNTSYNSGAIRVINISDGGSLFWINHNSPTSQFMYWMDANDKMLLDDMNGDGRKDLIFANTADFSNGYLRAYNIYTQADIGRLNTLTNYNEWFDCDDRILIGDLLGSNNKDIIMVNGAYTNGAFLISNISSTSDGVIRAHSTYTPALTTWKDGTDNNSLYCFAPVAGVNKNASLGTVTIYPNPSTGIVYLEDIELGAQIDIYDALGKKVISQVAANKTILLDCNLLTAGIYFVTVTEGSSIRRSKVFIEK